MSGKPRFWVVVLLVSCATPTYRAPTRNAVPNTLRPKPAALDSGAPARLQELAAQCRLRLEGPTLEAALAALDAAHEVLGVGCDVGTVGRDPLHWALRCRADAMFDDGGYQLETSRRACGALGGVFVQPWECVGALLASVQRRAARDERTAGLERIEAVVVGHVDREPRASASDAHVCTRLHKTFGYAPSVPWQALSDAGEDEERLYANDQRAWCRAASVAERLRAGLERGAPRAAAPLSLAVVGASTSWQRSQPDGCSGSQQDHGERSCAAARRIDVLLRLVPQADDGGRQCDGAEADARGALDCLQQCVERAAAGDLLANEATGPAAPLFVPGQATAGALPGGFYLHGTGAAEVTLDLRRVCELLGIARVHCI